MSIVVSVELSCKGERQTERHTHTHTHRSWDIQNEKLKDSNKERDIQQSTREISGKVAKQPTTISFWSFRGGGSLPPCPKEKKEEKKLWLAEIWNHDDRCQVSEMRHGKSGTFLSTGHLYQSSDLNESSFLDEDGHADQIRGTGSGV